MKISVEELVAIIVEEVVIQLQKKGIKINRVKSNEAHKSIAFDSNQTIHNFEFSGYKRPLITEEKIIQLKSNIKEISVPQNTIFTPSALDLVRKRKIKINKDG